MSIFPIGARVGADTSAFISSLGAATGSLRAFTGAAGLAGGALGAFAGAAVMGVAVSKAREYQSELLKLNTLVGIQTEQIEEWDQAMREIAETTGQVPADLARAMFAITSGGARGAAALDILEQAAKASTLGLGDMTAIGRTATAMMTAFADQGLTGSEAVDILTATVREGNLEASSLAGSFSRVLGPAAALGARVEDLGAFLATFTRLGGSTEQAATGLLNVFNLLIKPPTEARAALEGMGLSVEDLRETIREDGLVPALLEMHGALEGNIDLLGEVVPNSRALIGILNTAGLQAEEFAQDVEDIGGAIGVVDEGMEAWSETSDATFTKFTAQLETTAVTLGEVLLPPLTLLLQILQPIVDLLQFSVEGWREIGGVIGWVGEQMGEAAQEALDIITPMQRVDFTLQNLATRMSELSDEQLGLVQGQLVGRIQELNRAIAEGGENTERLVAQRDREVQQLGVVNREMRNRVAVEREVVEVTEDNAAAQELLNEAERDRLDSIDQIISGLEEQRLAEEEGELAVLMRQLETLNASDATLAYAQAQFIAIREAREMARAEAEAARETERAAEARRREAERMRKERQRAAEQAAEAARRAAEREDLARIQNELREITRISTDMANAVGDAFEDMVTGSKSVADAFGDMVTEILRQVQRLLIQRAIVEPLVGSLLGTFAPGASAPSASDFTQRSAELTAQIPGSITGPNMVSAQPMSMQGSPTIVQQNITFSPSMIDQQSGVQFLRQHGGQIANIVGEAAQRSSDLSSVLSGNG